MDVELIRFHSRVMKIAESEFRASCSGGDAETFVGKLFEEYKTAGKNEGVDAWLKSVLAKHFLCVGAPPEWVEEEPSWPCLNGRPMVFIGQWSLPKNAVTEKHLVWDKVVYLFGARVPYKDAFKMEYRVVTQISGFGGTGER